MITCDCCGEKENSSELHFCKKCSKHAKAFMRKYYKIAEKIIAEEALSNLNTIGLVDVNKM